MKECELCHRCLEGGQEFCPNDGAPFVELFPGPATLDGRYRLLRGVGRGGMGRVYRARHLGLKRLVAVKLLDPRRASDAGFLSRFEREAEILGQLEHPSIVAVSDFGIEPERKLPYLVMEHLEGVTLSEWLRREGVPPLEKALPILEAVAEALDYAHARGVLHRDLKPGNVFLVDKGAPAPEVKVLDFGLSCFYADRGATTAWIGGGPPPISEGPADAALDLTDGVLGTPGYVAPELLRSEPPTPAADLYSLGALICAVLTGRLPDRDLCPGLERILSPALASEVSRRPASARAVVAGLRRDVRSSERRRQSLRWMAVAALLGLAAVPLAVMRA